MEEAFLVVAEVPIVGAEATEEDAEDAGDGGRLRDDVGWLGRLGRGWVAGGIGLLVLHRKLLV